MQNLCGTSCQNRSVAAECCLFSRFAMEDVTNHEGLTGRVSLNSSHSYL